MKTILIIYPHFPPSNLAGVHRARLIANYINEFNWQATILTVEEKYYEEKLDIDLNKTISEKVLVKKTNAFPVISIGNLRLIGDIGIRGFFQLLKEARVLIHQNKYDFIWIPIPSWYTSLLGRILYHQYKIPYGIDYIDPWVSQLAPYDGLFSRAWFSNQIARILEPIAVKKASLISGVAQGYYSGVLERNFKRRKIETVAMPYGFDPNDHIQVPSDTSLPWNVEDVSMVYAGAFLPQSHYFIKLFFSSISILKSEGKILNHHKFFFLGTGFYRGKKISDYAMEYGISDHIFEIQDRFPFLQILYYLSQSAGVMVIGSTEKHYTASKTFQCLLSQKPVFAMLHEESSAASILKQCMADDYAVLFHEDIPEEELREKITDKLLGFIRNEKNWQPDLSILEAFSSKKSAEALIKAIEKITLK